jgi:hypothetical protein
VSATPTLERSLAALPLPHRRVVAETIGAASPKPAAIAAILSDEAHLAGLVAGLPNGARAAVTELAFADVELWAPGSVRPPDAASLDVLERHGLALCFRSAWSLVYVAPSDLVPVLRRIRIRAHARRIADAAQSAAAFPTSEQLLHDIASLGATIAHGAVQIKADGDLYAKARPKLAASLPPLGDGTPDFGERRIDLGLALLQELDMLRVASDDLPGRSTRRALELGGDLAELLDRPFGDRVRLAGVLRRTFNDLQLIDPLLDELAGRTIGLQELGAAVNGLFDEACKLSRGDEGTDVATALAAVRLRVLAGGATLGVDAAGDPVTVTLRPPPPLEPAGPPCVAQADFELVALRPLVPSERADLELLCEPVPGREHMARVTRERIHGAVKVLRERDPAVILGRLGRLAGALPQNVARAVEDWVVETPPRARLRSAIIVDLGDAELGERVAERLGPLVVERLAPHLLAVAAGDIGKVATGLRKAGVELDPGLDRVSGAWQEPKRVEDHSGLWWRPSAEPDGHLSAPHGRLVSGLDQDSGPADASPISAAAILARLQELNFGIEEYDDEDDEDDDEAGREPAEVLLDAYAADRPVELRYAAAEGTVVLQGTVAELDGARFKLSGPLAGPLRWRWLKGLLEVREIDD